MLCAGNNSPTEYHLIRPPPFFPPLFRDVRCKQHREEKTWDAVTFSRVVEPGDARAWHETNAQEVFLVKNLQGLICELGSLGAFLRGGKGGRGANMAVITRVELTRLRSRQPSWPYPARHLFPPPRSQGEPSKVHWEPPGGKGQKKRVLACLSSATMMMMTMMTTNEAAVASDKTN